MRSSSTTQTAQDLKQLRAEVTRLSNIVKEMPEHAKSDVGNVIGFNSKELRKMARDAGKNARRFLKDKQDQAAELRDDAEERITSHPFRSVGIAAAFGAVFGAIFGATRR
jgi:ElaB/YqjD/DUF883 family membrane-anchored ribosome-binding protein